MELSDSAHTVLRHRYLMRDPITWEPTETPEQLCRRVAHAAAEIEDVEDRETWETAFFQMIDEQRFIPNSPALMNAGIDEGEWNACYVLPIEDTMESIFETLYTAAMVHRFGGGTGFDFSRLRPRADRVYRTQGEASGPVSFLEMYDAVTQTIKQGGRRRGANMAVLRVDHPDIKEFITCKDAENTKIINFNISVGVTDEFMRAVEDNESWDLINPRDGEVTETVQARELFNMIAEHAWLTGDPGILFLDEANKFNPTPAIGVLEATNPCGESWLLPNEACTLGSMNMSKFVSNGKIMWNALKNQIMLAIRFLDNAVDASSYATEDIMKMHRANRKIGLGIMGWHDMLIQLGIPYVSEEAYDLVDKIGKFIQDNAHIASGYLADERGVFPNYEEAYTFKAMWGKQRNAHVTVIAPTGTISIIAGCSSGIEPIFALAIRRENVLGGETLYDVHLLFLEKLAELYPEEHGRRAEIQAHIAESGICPKPETEAEEKLFSLFQTANEIPWQEHIKMQAKWQQYTDNAVSKTINMHESVTVEDVTNAYMAMWQHKCKGGTIYRNLSKSTQVLNHGTTQTTTSEVPVNDVWQRPDTLSGKTHKIPTGLGSAYIVVNCDENGTPVEVFVEVGKAGSDVAAFEEAIGRTISVALQHHVPVEELSKQLTGIGGAARTLQANGAISVPDAIGRVLMKYAHDHTEPRVATTTPARDQVPVYVTQDICPQCSQATLERVSRCDTCHNCGYSTC